jgi:hypothetical protein
LWPRQYILNHNITDQSLALNAFAKHLPLAPFLAIGQKYTQGAAMESNTQSQLLEQVRSVIEVTPHMA